MQRISRLNISKHNKSGGSGGGSNTGKKDKLVNNEDKDCHGKKSWEYIFSVYAPQVGGPVAEKGAFWGMLDDVTTVAESKVLLVAGNLNRHIGEDRRGFEELMGAHGFG